MTKAIFWMRRDIRLVDNTALSEAVKKHTEVYPVFIFDKNILSKLDDQYDQRVSFIYDHLERLKKTKKIHVFYGDPVVLIPQISRAFKTTEVFANEDYEGYAIQRDKEVAKKINLHLYKDQVVFRYDEIKNGQGLPYKVFTPYKKKWIYELESDETSYCERQVNLNHLASSDVLIENEVSSLEQIGFKATKYPSGNKTFNINLYKSQRDFPAVDGTSRLSVHLRFGTVSVRTLIRKNMPFDNEEKKIWLSELAWRDFYFAVLGNFSFVQESCFIKEFDKIKWENNEKLFQAWKEGRTGVPIVDAGMRQLNQTGWMHNRVRMIVASYLCKTLLIDWRWGEKYFAQKLIDYDLAANNGGWQWSASTGCDAAPYFRIFNPYTQGERFDKDAVYIKNFVPELETIDAKKIHSIEKNPIAGYPLPIVDYKSRRAKALLMYKEAKEG